MASIERKGKSLEKIAIECAWYSVKYVFRKFEEWSKQIFSTSFRYLNISTIIISLNYISVCRSHCINYQLIVYFDIYDANDSGKSHNSLLCYYFIFSNIIVIMFFKKESNKDKNWSPFVGFGDIIFEDFWNWKKEEKRNRMTQCLWCKWRMLDLTWRMFEIVWKGERTVKYLCKHYCITNSYTLIFFTFMERWINN